MKAKMHTHAEIACSLRPCTVQALMMHLSGECAISPRTWVLALVFISITLKNSTETRGPEGFDDDHQPVAQLHA